MFEATEVPVRQKKGDRIICCGFLLIVGLLAVTTGVIALCTPGRADLPTLLAAANMPVGVIFHWAAGWVADSALLLFGVLTTALAGTALRGSKLAYYMAVGLTATGYLITCIGGLKFLGLENEGIWIMIIIRIGFLCLLLKPSSRSAF
jgi:hypothetical protein